MSGSVYLRDIDGSGSMHPCAKGDLGAIEYIPGPAAAPTPMPPYHEGDADKKLATDWYTWGFQSGFEAGRRSPVADLAACSRHRQ